MLIDKQTWAEADILELISLGVTEDLHLDYKSCGSIENNESKRNEMGKDVSAFANSAGGVIIYGVRENGPLATGIDIGYDPSVFSKEWVEQVISSRVTPKIAGLRIFQVVLATTNPGRVIYVVSIPQSKNAPHMAKDNKYYKRYNFESKPMEHYEVQDVSRRQTVPDLEIKLEAVDVVDGATPSEINFTLGGSIENHSPQPAEYSIQKLFIDSRITTISVNGYMKNGHINREYEGNEAKLDIYLKNHGLGNSMPLWKGPTFALTRVRLQALRNQTYFVGWEIDSPGMETKSELIKLSTQYGIVTLESIQ